MSNYPETLTDHRGHTMFLCSHCSAPLTGNDLIDLGMRIPDPDETADDYREAELIDELSHHNCLSARQAG